MTITPNIDTKALRELEAKATPGPWSSSYYGDGQFVVNIPRERSLCFHPRPPSGSDDQSATVYGAPGVAKILPGDVVVGMSGWELDGLTEQEYANQRVADGQLIVALRNAAPALLDLADRAQEQARECASNLRSLRASQEECYSLYEERDALKAELERLRSDAEKGDYIPTSMYLQRCEELRTAQREAESVSHWIRLNDMATAKLSASEREAERLRADVAKVCDDWVHGDTHTTDWLLSRLMPIAQRGFALRGEEAPRG